MATGWWCELMAGHRFGWVLGTHCSFASAHTTPQLHLWSTIMTPATAAYTFRVYSLPLLLVVRVSRWIRSGCCGVLCRFRVGFVWAWYGFCCGFAVKSRGFAPVSRGISRGFAVISRGFAPVSRRFRAGFARFRAGFARFRAVSPMCYHMVSQGIARYRKGFTWYRRSYLTVETGYMRTAKYREKVVFEDRAT